MGGRRPVAVMRTCPFEGLLAESLSKLHFEPLVETPVFSVEGLLMRRKPESPESYAESSYSCKVDIRLLLLHSCEFRVGGYEGSKGVRPPLGDQSSVSVCVCVCVREFLGN